MKKFYLQGVLSVFFLILFSSAHAQIYSGGVYVTRNTGGAGGNWSNLSSWLTLPPPNSCTNCQIFILGVFTMDVNDVEMHPGPDAAHPSTLIVDVNATFNVEQFMKLYGTDVTISSSATMNVDDEMHLYNSQITLNQSTSTVFSINGGGNPSHGTIFPGSTFDVGIYYNLDGSDPMDVNSEYALDLNQNAIIHSVAGTPVDFFPNYTFNCGASPVCAQGIVYGPAFLQNPGLASPQNFIQFVSNIPLPVTLVKFDASLANENSVNVSWTTSEEINSSYFVVERSADATSWQPIGQVSAKGHSSGLVDYKFVDPSPTNATNFYRLRMVDLDAKYKFSKVAKVSLEARVAALMVFNNPFHDQIRIKVDLSSAELLELKLTDISGRTYTQQSVRAVPGANYFNINSAPGGNGIYILTVRGQSYNQTVKLLKE